MVITTAISKAIVLGAVATWTVALVALVLVGGAPSRGAGTILQGRQAPAMVAPVDELGVHSPFSEAEGDDARAARSLVTREDLGLALVAGARLVLSVQVACTGLLLVTALGGAIRDEAFSR